MVDLRYSTFPSVSPYMNWAIWEYARKPEIGITTPTVVLSRANESGIDFGNYQSLSEYAIPGNIPQDWVFTRGLSPKHGHNTIMGPMFFSPDVLYINLFLPDTFDTQNVSDRALMCVTKALRKNDLPCFYKGNDIYYRYNGDVRKVSAVMYQDWGNGWCSYQLILTFNLDIATIDTIIDWTKQFWINKGITSLGDIVGMLYDVDDTLNINQIGLDIVSEVANNVSMDMVPYTPTGGELSILQTLATGLSSNDWLFNLIHPDLGQQ